MANRFREFVESIVYAGMKPGGNNAATATAAKPGIFGFLDRYLSSPASSDPLYLTNQTLGQRMRRVSVVAVPVVLLTAVGIVVYMHYAARMAPPAKALTRAEVAQQVLPNFNPNIKLESNHELEVSEVHFQHTGANLMLGSLENKTDHLIKSATVVFDLTDNVGTVVGSITVEEDNLAPGSVRTFQRPIASSDAALGVVRDLQTH